MIPYRPTGINQITLRVNDMARAEAFYAGVLGLTLDRRMGQTMTVFRMGPDTLVLVEAETAYDNQARDYRMDHFGFSVPDAATVDAMAAYFRDQDIRLVAGPTNRKTGRFLFITDPDGNLIEIYSE